MSFLRSLKGFCGSRPRRLPCRPQAEPLEDRSLPAFVPGVTVVTDPFPAAVLTADFNADGKADFVVASYTYQGTVNVFLGKGNGDFELPKGFDAGNFPGALAAGDLDNDGKLDLAVADTQYGLGLLFGNGDGTFQAPIKISTGLNPVGVAVADFNGDNKDDVALTVTGSTSVKVCLAPAFVPSTVNVFSNPGGVVAADFTNDGKPDLAVTRYYKNDVVVLKNTGGGTFQILNICPVGSGPTALTGADVTGDGKLDLVVSNQDAGTVSVLPGSGTGNFGAAQDFAAGPKPRAVVVGQFAVPLLSLGSNPLDVAVVNRDSGTVSVLRGTGGGQFAAPTTIAVGSHPGSLATADFNKDGRLDLVVTDAAADTAGVLLQVRPAFPNFPFPQTPPPDDQPVSDWTDVTGVLAVRQQWKKRGRRWTCRMTLTNLSDQPLTNLDALVVLAGAKARLLRPSGISVNVMPGEPFVSLNPSTLLPGEKAQLVLRFAARRKPRFQMMVVEAADSP
jgi:hypothetical protein